MITSPGAMMLFLGYTIASVTGLLIMKHQLSEAVEAWQNATFINIPVLLAGIGALLYMASFAIWIVILARYELSVAYPVCVGLTVVCTVVGAGLLLGENIGLIRVFGVALIICGIWITSSF